MVENGPERTGQGQFGAIFFCIISFFLCIFAGFFCCPVRLPSRTQSQPGDSQWGGGGFVKLKFEFPLKSRLHNQNFPCFFFEVLILGGFDLIVCCPPFV